MLVPPDINTVFDICEKVEEIEADLSEADMDDVLDTVLDATDGVGHVEFVQKCALEGLDAFSIQKLLRFRAVELKDQIKRDAKGHLQDVQTLRNTFITRDDIYMLVYNVMNNIIFLDKNELVSLDKWRERLINRGGSCLFERNNEINNLGFLFAFQTKEQKELTKLARVLCLDGTHGMNYHGFHLFTIMMHHPITGSVYPIAFLISEFKRSLTLERRLGHKHGMKTNPNKEIIWKDLWRLLRTKGWSDTEAQQQIIKTIGRWREIDDEGIKEFAKCFEHWWKPRYEMWMICARGLSRNNIDMNNLIEFFHNKLKYTFRRGCPGRRLDSEVYLLVEVVLQDMNFSIFLNELKIGWMNPQQRQQRIREITGTKHIDKNDVYKIQQDVWLVRSMTNNDVEYSVCKRDNSDETNLDITSYVCSCLNFKKCQLACKHIFSVLAQLRIYDDNKENEHVNIEIYDRNVEITKLQEDLAAIIVEWREKNAQDIRSLRESFRQTAQAERARIARAEIVPQVNEMRTSQIASNIRFKKQSNF
ncbi:hypothetical protein F8M41_025271 [Gigaspora margarita]|uniref:SWIM-type domain-containing protein n=1 Tax=Gigaspora margarita TaxID=4874 RepID=A0A8H3XKG5_GIGMA|nr:hypothetical protein F8M41_025271 [Gigaspora margarita]